MITFAVSCHEIGILLVGLRHGVRQSLGDAHRLSGALVTLALAVVDGSDDLQTERTIERLLMAFAEHPREEPFEVWALLQLEARLRKRGLVAWADEIERLIVERRERVSTASS